MSLTLLIGPANSAKAGEVLGAVRSLASRRPLLVVPTAADVTTYRRELAGDGALLGAEVVRFGGLVREIAQRAGVHVPVVGPLRRERLVAAAVAAAPLELLAASASAPGFAAAAGDLIAALTRGLVTPARFAQALGAWAGEDEGRRAYAREVGAIPLRYADALERIGAVDPDGLAWRALDALRQDPAAWGTTPVLLYGFDDLTPAQRDAVETLARVEGCEVTLSLTYEPGRRAFASRARTAMELTPLADRVIELPARSEHYVPTARAALHRLERELFEDAPPPPQADASGELRLFGDDLQSEPAGELPDPGDAIRLLESGGARAEAEQVGKLAVELLGSGWAPDELAVVVREPGRSAGLIEQVLQGYGVPVVADRAARADHTPLGRALLGLARTALDPAAEPDALLAWLRSPGLLRNPGLADRLEAELRRRALRTAAEAVALWHELTPSFHLDAVERLQAAASRGAAPVAALLRRELLDLLAAPRRAEAAPLLGADLPDARVAGALLRALIEVEGLERDAGPAAALLPELAALEVEVERALPGGSVLITGPLGIRARRFRGGRALRAPGG